MYVYMYMCVYIYIHIGAEHVVQVASVRGANPRTAELERIRRAHSDSPFLTICYGVICHIGIQQFSNQ